MVYGTVKMIITITYLKIRRTLNYCASTLNGITIFFDRIYRILRIFFLVALQTRATKPNPLSAE